MNRNKTIQIIFLGTSIAAFGCTEEEKARTAEATATDEDNVNVVFDDGETATSIDEYEAVVAADPDLVTESHAFALTVSAGADAGPLVAIGKFKIRVFVSTDYLAGCINQRMPHLVIQVTNDATSLALVELHIAGWFSGKAPCLGLLNESVIAYGFCLKGCFSTNSKTAVKNSVKNGLVAAGISGTVAAILSALIAPVATGALGL